MKHILKYYLPIFAITLCSIYSCTSTNEGISNTVKMKFHESSIIATDFSDSFNSIKPESATNDAIITNIERVSDHLMNIAEDLKEFAKKRNEYARTKGYSNYFEYKLKDSYEVDLKELENLLNDIYSKSQDLIKETQNKIKEELSKEFGIEKENLKSYHDGFLTENNPEKKVNDFIKNKEQILEIAKKTYLGMGYDIEKLEKDGKLTLDLYPRKGKNTHGFCFGIDQEADARILANLTNNSMSLETLNHELGHCIYTLGTVKTLPFFDREQYPAMTEAIAMMMQDLQKREDVLKDLIPQELLNEYNIDINKIDNKRYLDYLK